MLVEQSGRRARANSSNARITILRISHQCEIVGHELRIDAEFCAHSCGVPDLHSLADDLDDAVIAHALREILVVGPDANLLDALVSRCEVRSRGEAIVGLELDHRPDRDAHRVQRVFQRLKLRPQVWLDPFAGFVVRPEVVAERFNHMVGGDAYVRGAGLDHFQYGMQHAGHRLIRLVLALIVASVSVEMAEQLVGSVD